MANEMIHLSLSKTFSSMSLKYPTPGRSAFLSPDGTPINAQTAQPTILIVDDDPDILTALYDLIEHEGFRVIGVSTCRDALVLAKTVEFAVVLLDIGLPDGDGLAVLETIQAITPSLPVIILTAFTSPTHARTGVRVHIMPSAPYSLPRSYQGVSVFPPHHFEPLLPPRPLSVWAELSSNCQVTCPSGGLTLSRLRSGAWGKGGQSGGSWWGTHARGGC